MVDVHNVESGIKSKERVSSFGEVYTPKHIVNDMLDLVDKEGMFESVNYTFLEPACGNGNFLIEIIRRKLNIITNRVSELEQKEIDLHILRAFATTYGVDILPDNVYESKLRMLNVLVDVLGEQRAELLNSVKFILDKNIILGNALTNELVDAEGVSVMLLKSSKQYISKENKAAKESAEADEKPARGKGRARRGAKRVSDSADAGVFAGLDNMAVKTSTKPVDGIKDTDNTLYVIEWYIYDTGEVKADAFKFSDLTKENNEYSLRYKPCDYLNMKFELLYDNRPITQDDLEDDAE